MPPIFSDVTAIAVARPYDGWAGKAVAPAPVSATLRRAVGTLHEPNAWTAGILLATGVALIARHPIARALGTEAETPTIPTSVATAPASPVRAAPAPAVAAPLLAVPTHAPRNPFAALIKTTNTALAAPATRAGHTPPVSFVANPPASFVAKPPVASAPPPAANAGGSLVSSCTGTVHRVVAGDTLWTLAARAVRSHDSGRVTIAWHKLYDANRAVVGADPSLLRIGTQVCVPDSL